jgi:hypothetical protein
MLFATPMLLLSACDDDSSTNNPTGPTTGVGGSGGAIEGICLLNNCADDTHCVGCPDGRDTCDVANSRCACTDDSCPDGEECSSFGICVPNGLTCPSDNDGNPTVICTQNSDCKACSPMNQVCDTVTGKCQACIETNTQHCLSSDICVDKDKDGRPESCDNKCPQSCEVDNDCAQCGGPGNEAHACNAHKCAECSDTFPCAAGLECINGVCTPPCGVPGPETGVCNGDEDCAFCGDPNGTPWDCRYPVNGGTHGNCTPVANGCSDLGTQVAVLPEPYNGYTQLCSNDMDCDGIGIQFNVGKAIRDLVGSNEINLGFTKIPIQDANIQYDMPVCAAIQLTDNISCGICAPCREDSDCNAIPIDPLIADLFKGDPLATIAGALLVDLLWGSNKDHSLHFWCQPVAFGYGACIPCGNPLQSCGQNSGGGMGNGTCTHDVQTVGDALTNSCSPCADTVCQADPFCCDTANDPGAWDQLCIDQATQLCASCAHDACTVGDKLDPSCNTCVTSVCGADPFCCQSTWDSVCVTQAQDTNTHPSCVNSCGGCGHSECTAGGALSLGCSTCVDDVCGNDPFCCNTDWDSQCVTEAEQSNACTCP